jgi:hypothetical protein
MSGARTAEFLMCAERRCYVAATMETEDWFLGVFSIRGFDLPGFAGPTPELTTFDDQPAEMRVAGRQGRWTPAILVEAQPNA